MNPQQPGGMPAPPSNPYAFITEPTKPPRSGGVGPVSSNPFIMKLILLIGGAVVLMVALAFGINLLFGSRTNLDDLVKLAATQQEIVRVTRQTIQPSDQNVANASISTRLSVLTQQQNMLTYLSQHRRTVKQNELALKKDTSTDKQLQQAQATSTFDIVFAQVMRQQLQSYSEALKTSWQNAPNGSKEKTMLATDYNQVQMLLKQWPS